MCQQNFFQLSIFFENEKINTRIYFRNISFYKFQDTHINIYFMIKEEIIKKKRHYNCYTFSCDFIFE